MSVFKKEVNPVNYYTNIINFNEDDFIEKVINSNNSKIDFIIISKDECMKSNSENINYELLDKKIKNAIKRELNNGVDIKNIKYKKIKIENKFFAIFINSKLNENKISLLYREIVNKKPESVQFFIKIIFGLLLKIEMIDIELRSGGLIEDSQYNNNPRYVLNTKVMNNGDYVFDVLEVETFVKNGRISTNLKAQRYKSKNNPNNDLLLNVDIDKYGRGNIDFVGSKVSEKQSQKLFYYQLIDKIIKERVLKRNNIDYKGEYFNYNHTFKGGDNMIASIECEDFIEVKLISTISREEIKNPLNKELRAAFSYILINSDEKIWEHFGLSKNDFMKTLEDFKNEYKSNTAFKSMIINQDDNSDSNKNTKIKVVEILYADEIKDFSKLSQNGNYLVINLKNKETDSSFKFNGEYTDKVKITLDVFKSKNFKNIQDFDFYTRLKIYNLLNSGKLVIQGFDLSIDKVSYKSKEFDGKIHPNGYLINVMKKINDELIIKSSSKRNNIRLLTSKKNPLKLDNEVYRVFYFNKKKYDSKTILFAVMMEIELINNEIKIRNKKTYIPKTDNDLNNADSFNQFIEEYPYLNKKDKSDIKDNEFIFYSEKDKFLITKNNSLENPRLIGNEISNIISEDIQVDNFSKSKEGHLKGIVMPSIDRGAGIYMDVREDCVYIKTASRDPINLPINKDNIIYKLSFKYNGIEYTFNEENIHIKNYFKIMTYNLIKFKNTSKKSFIEKILDIEVNN